LSGIGSYLFDIDRHKARFELIEWASSTISSLDLTAEKLPAAPNLRK
jgi:hypothetical protein